MSPKELAEAPLAVDECPDDLPPIGSPYRSWEVTEERKAEINLDEARKIEQAMSPLPWIVLEGEFGEFTIIRSPNHPLHKDGLIKWGLSDEATTPDAKGLAYIRTTYSALLNEIESLRSRLDAAHRLIKEQDTRIKEFESW